MRHVKRVLSSLLLLTLFATYQVSITMFTHIHFVDGVLVTHSHPNKGNHTHSTTAMLVIDRLAAIHSLEAVGTFVDIEPLRPLFCLVKVQAVVSVVVGAHLRVLSLRAPPMA